MSANGGWQLRSGVWEAPNAERANSPLPCLFLELRVSGVTLHHVVDLEENRDTERSRVEARSQEQKGSFSDGLCRGGL